VLLDYFKQILSSSLSCEDFSLSDHDVLLKVIGGLLRNTEVFHVCWYLDLAFGCQSEKVIYSISTCKNYGCMIENINFLLSEVTYIDRIDCNELSKVYLEIVLFS
jgi:hypothetical protein